MLDTLTSADFSRYIGQAFFVYVEGGEPMELVLVEVAELGAAPSSQRRHAFSVIFVGPDRSILPQRIYRVEHEDMGAFDLFLVPLGPDRAGGIRYEAVFA